MSLQRVRDGLQQYQTDTLDPRPRVGFGLPTIDKLFGGGLRKAQCCMVMAVSSVGKTTIGLSAIAANPDVATLMFSIEMTWPQVVARLTSMTTGTPEWELEEAMKSGEYPKQMLDTSNRYPLLLGDDASEMPVKEMKLQVEKARQQLGMPIRLILIDYLELIGGAGLMGKGEQVDKAAVKVLSLAKDTGASVVLLHQVGKGDGGGGFKPLSLESGRYGGHQPMHAVVGAYAPRLNPELKPAELEAVRDDLYLQVLKNRVTGRAHPEGMRMRLDPTTGKLSEWGAPGVPSLGYQAELNHWSERDEDRYMEEVLR
jgi:hypothetical protein